MANGAQNASGTPAPAASHSGGHVVSARATTIGLMAILLWSFMAGTVRIVSENFGATLGSALIYTVGGILLLMFRRPAPIREFPKKYLIIGGLLFVFYESSISLSLGLASTDASSVEVSLVNYLWPTMMVLLSAGVSHRKHAVVKVLPGAIVATAGVVLAVGGNSGLDWHAAVQHIATNPLPYALAFVGALAWSVYAVFTPAMSHGVDGTSLFFPCVAVALWIIHFASGQGWPAEPPSLVAWLFVLIAAAAIGGGYACWGYGILHGSMERLAIASYATPVLSTGASAVLLGLALSLPFWCGALLVAAGSVLNYLVSARKLRGDFAHGAVSQNDFILRFHNFFKPPHGPFTAPWINYRPMGSSNLLAAALGRAANRVKQRIRIGDAEHAAPAGGFRVLGENGQRNRPRNHNDHQKGRQSPVHEESEPQYDGHHNHHRDDNRQQCSTWVGFPGPRGAGCGLCC